jgi:hypothetical protein
MCPQNAGNAISETEILKIQNSTQLILAYGTLLTTSVLAYYSEARAWKMGSLAIFPHPAEESLTNAM